MVRKWLYALAFLAGVSGLACSSNDGSGSGGSVRVVASEDGSVQVIAQGKTLFSTAPTGPVARTFNETFGGIGVISFRRNNERADPMSVRAVSNEGGEARVEYASGSRSAILTAAVVDDQATDFTLEVAGAEADSIAVGVRCDADGTFHGFGMQYNATNQRGEQFPLFVNEQGVGRTGGGGINEGDEHTTYFPMPYYIDARGFGALFTTKSRVHVDLCATDEEVAWFEVISWGTVRWRVFHGPTPLDVVRQLGDLVGRPTAPPAWSYNLWLASQGGSDTVLAEVAELEAASIPASALWVQDWTGIRPNQEGGFGVQYLWEPKESCSGPDDVCYPDFAQYVSNLHGRGYKFLAYVNPFIVDPSSVSEADDPSRFAPRFDAMEQGGLLVKDEDQQTYIDGAVANFPQFDGHPDFSKGETSDFGEYLPFDSVHADGSIADERRNTFPVDWHRVNRQALEQARPDGDWVSFARSGFTNVQGVALIHWVGDQQTDWSELDGIPTVVPALLNLGLAGQPFVSMDIGGFSAGSEPTTKELYQRWTELGAFVPVMRTHQGAEKELNWRWNSDEETIAHFRKFTYVHCALFDDFVLLSEESAATGAPLLRHMMLVFPGDRETWDISDQFMIGDSLLVAPVVTEGATSRSVYFPQGTWYNVWTADSVEGGQRITVDAPIGSPAVYSRNEDRPDIRSWEELPYEVCR